MALTGDQLVALACEAAHSPNKTAQAKLFLNQILSDLCEQYEFADARGIFLFDFNPTLVSTLPGGQYGSGPIALPLDYLRASGSSGSSGGQRFAIWYLNGTPYPMIPCDLAEFDIQIQQAGLQSYPWLVTTNMGDVVTDRFILTTTGDLLVGSTAVTNLAATTGLVIGASVAVAGEGIVAGSTFTYLGGSAGTLSQAPVTSISKALNTVGASLMFGVAPSAYVYNPPSGAYPVQIRYQRQMPDIFNFGKIPWFRSQGYLQEKLIQRMCELNDDSRASDFMAKADDTLRRYLELKDDTSNRSKRIQMDRRRFRPLGNRLPPTKALPWG